MKKYITVLLVVLITVLALPTAAVASPEAKATLLMDYETGQIIIGDNIDAALPPASITKLMTMHLIFEALAQGDISLTDEVTASANASNLPPGASTIFLGTGEVLTVEELLQAVAIISANDAGIALAEHVAGSESSFVDMMNTKAQEFGMDQTNFLNSHGLHTPGHTMSARDVATLSQITINRFPQILEYSQQEFIRMERQTRYVREGYFDLHSTFANLIGHRSIDGLKTGWTPEAGRCISVTALEGERRYIAVVMGAEDIEQRDEIVKDMISTGLDQYQAQTAITAGTVMGTVEVTHAKEQEVNVVTDQDITLVMRRDQTLEDYDDPQIDMRSDLQAPLSQGDIVGSLTISQNGNAITTMDLVLEQDVEKAGFVTRTLRFLSQVFVNLGNWILSFFS